MGSSGEPQDELVAASGVGDGDAGVDVKKERLERLPHCTPRPEHTSASHEMSKRKGKQGAAARKGHWRTHLADINKECGNADKREPADERQRKHNAWFVQCGCRLHGKQRRKARKRRDSYCSKSETWF